MLTLRRRFKRAEEYQGVRYCFNCTYATKVYTCINNIQAADNPTCAEMRDVCASQSLKVDVEVCHNANTSLTGPGYFFHAGRYHL